MLYLIGLGLNDERNLGERAKQIAKMSECFCELYTSKWFGSIPNLQAEIGNKIQVVDRGFLEEGEENFVLRAKKRKIVLFVPGDPLAATTHINLLLAAKKNKIPVKIIHNSSIFSAIAETGLQLYKFGKTATIPFSGHTESVEKTIKENRKTGSHTLLLLDLQAEHKTYMHPEVALQLLLHKKILTRKEKVVIGSRLGKNSYIKYGKVSDLLKTKIDTPAIIIVPGKLHFAEKEFLELLEIRKQKNKIEPEKIVKNVRKRLKIPKFKRPKVRKKIRKYTKGIKKPVRKLTKRIKRVTRR